MTAPDLLKIDVEGLEEEALRGAKRALVNRATIVLEVQSANLFTRCRTLLEPQGYRLFALDDDALTMTACPAGDVTGWFNDFVQGRALNYLCVARDAHLLLAQQGVARVRALLDA